MCGLLGYFSHTIGMRHSGHLIVYGLSKRCNGKVICKTTISKWFQIICCFHLSCASDIGAHFVCGATTFIQLLQIFSYNKMH